MFRFNSLLVEAGFDPRAVRLVRHRHPAQFQRQFHEDAISGHPRFEQYQSGQSNPRVVTQMSSAAVLAAFAADMAGDTIFVGMFGVLGVTTGPDPDPYRSRSGPARSDIAILLLRRLQPLADYRGRIVVDWGGGERAWVQYAHRHDKHIVEVRRSAVEPPFPGYSRFMRGLHEIESLPSTWLEPLRVARGVYLLVHRTTGAQYVGSATGADGFLGRWRGYADGHGGNVGLRELGHAADQYDVRILETAGSGAENEDVYALESLWKDKLGSRVKGLNRN